MILRARSKISWQVMCDLRVRRSGLGQVLLIKLDESTVIGSYFEEFVIDDGQKMV